MPPGNTCATCRHWRPSANVVNDPIGGCEKMVPPGASVHIVGARAIAGGPHVLLVTHRNFGCVLHEVKP